jgi:predicted ABC-type ATPase
MIVVAGPPGSCKSSVFPVAQTGVDFFNIDDRAAQLHGGSYQKIPPEIRAEANRDCELFIADHIRARKSFAVETTLRTRKALEQARQARLSLNIRKRLRRGGGAGPSLAGLYVLPA